MSRVIIVNSDAVRRGLTRAGVAADFVRVIYNGVIPERFRDADPLPWREQFNWRDDALLVGYAGQFSESKGVSDFLAAAERVLECDDRCRFVLVGKMDETNACYRELSSHVRQRQLDEKIVFVGWMTDMERVYATLDIMVVPSRHEEAAANVLIEAAAAGVPVIATRVGGTPELVDHGVTGILVATRSPEQIAEAIMTLAKDPDLRRTMRDAGKQRAKTMLTRTGMPGVSSTSLTMRSLTRQAGRESDLSAAAAFFVWGLLAGVAWDAFSEAGLRSRDARIVRQHLSSLSATKRRSLFALVINGLRNARYLVLKWTAVIPGRDSQTETAVLLSVPGLCLAVGI
jgi:hypothetical protein